MNKHQKRQIEVLNNIILEKEQSVISLISEEERMQKRIDEIKDKYTLLDNYGNLKEKIAALESSLKRIKQEVEDKSLELEILCKKIDIAKEIESIKMLRLELKKEQEKLEEYKNSNIPVSDILIGIYSKNEDDEDYYDGKYLVNAFRLIDTLYFDDLDYDTVLVYQSLSKDLIAMCSRNFDSIYDEDYDTEEYVANVEIDYYLSFSEASIMINSSLYLNVTISPSEINQVLQDLLQKFKVKEDKDGDIRIVSRKNPKRTRQKH